MPQTIGQTFPRTGFPHVTLQRRHAAYPFKISPYSLGVELVLSLILLPFLVTVTVFTVGVCCCNPGGGDAVKGEERSGKDYEGEPCEVRSEKKCFDRGRKNLGMVKLGIL